MNIGVLCNSKLCIPSVQTILQLGHKVLIGMPEKIGDDHSQVEQFAQCFTIPVTRFKNQTLDDELIFWKDQHHLDFIFVITFPYILSANLISTINVDIINFHFAPLPQYRGAVPAFWVIKNGEKKGGVSAHMLTEKIDSGKIVHFEPYTISSKETFKSYLNSTAILNASVIKKVMERLVFKSWKKKLNKQNKANAGYYPKPQLDDIRINWEKMTAEEIERLCRACNPWNKGAIAILNQQPIKLVEVSVLINEGEHESPGKIVLRKEANSLVVACKHNKYLTINIAYHEDLGFFSNNRLSQLGFKEGLSLQ